MDLLVDIGKLVCGYSMQVLISAGSCFQGILSAYDWNTGSVVWTKYIFYDNLYFLGLLDECWRFSSIRESI